MKSVVGGTIKNTSFRVVFKLAIPHVSIELGEPNAKFAEIRTREILMSVLNTLAKRTDDVVAAISSTLDALVANPMRDVSRHLLGNPRDPDG